ncbi:MAG: hypothetical protein JWR01_844 [Subtercola sp.]|nr:hypothetical protein [Subtercola sp.]
MLITVWTLAALLLRSDGRVPVLLSSIAVIVALSTVAATVVMTVELAVAMRGTRLRANGGGGSGSGSGVVTRDSLAVVRGSQASGTGRVRVAEPPRVDIDAVIAAMERAFVDREASQSGRQR